MESLEAKIPPPLVALVIGAAMWWVSRFTPLLHIASTVRLWVAIAIFVVGSGFGVAGVIAFRRARTTIDPTKPDSASSLVSSGVYRITRNPMYVGLSFALVAWAVFLDSTWALLGPVAFVLFVGRFQIAPEERALEKLFGSQYADYCARVRRWL